MSKFDSVRDEILNLMVMDGWANESDGNVESPTGFFARISNDEDEIVSIVDAFGKEAFEIDSNFDFSELVGNFLIVENDQGFVYVTEYTTESELLSDYKDLARLYRAWERD